jgi:sulfur carrier protein
MTYARKGAAVTITVNGEARDADAGTTVADVIAGIGADRAGSAVAVNGDVVSRTVWPARTLADGDRVEVLGAAPGG